MHLKPRASSGILKRDEKTPFNTNCRFALGVCHFERSREILPFLLRPQDFSAPLRFGRNDTFSLRFELDKKQVAETPFNTDEI